MSLSRTLFREKTNVPVKLSTTFNAPGTYFPPFGKTVFTIGGKGTSGNAPTGGNFAGNNPSSPGSPASTYWSRFTQTVSVHDGDGASFFSSDGPNFGSSTSLPGPSNFATYNSSAQFFTTVYSYYNNISFTPGNSPSAGNPNFNAFVPGNNGANSTVLGVPFPGGVAGPAQTVADTPVSIPYSPSGISVTVPSGGLVTIKNN